MPSNSVQQNTGQCSAVLNRPDSVELKVKIGDVLQLQMLEQPERGRFRVTVIGLHEGRNLIVSAPMSNGSLLLLREGQMFVVRSLTGKKVLGFRAEIVKCYMNPYPYVHLRIPGDIEEYDVRNAWRVDVELIASVSVLAVEQDGGEEEQQTKKERSLPALLQNISTTGCLIQLSDRLDESVSRLMLSLRVDVAEHNRTMKINACVCSHREQHDSESGKIQHLYGLRFEQMEDDHRLMLYCFVYEKIAHQIYSG